VARRAESHDSEERSEARAGCSARWRMTRRERSAIARKRFAPDGEGEEEEVVNASN